MADYEPKETPQEEPKEELQAAPEETPQEECIGTEPDLPQDGLIASKEEPVPAADRPREGKRKAPWITLLAVVIAAAAITVSEIRGGPLPTWDEIYTILGVSQDALDRDKCLAVHFIDVGQGDCIYVRAPDGSDMLIDAGENGNDKKILAYLKKYGDRELDYVVATHPHSDHIGSLDEVIADCTVHNVIMPRLSDVNTPTTSGYTSLLKAVKKSKAKVISAKPGKVFMLQDAVCTVLSPKTQSENLNNMSVVLRLELGERSFLFTGDAETEVEKQMLQGDYASKLNVDVLKLGHHGSHTSSSAAFLKAVLPEYGVISCGAGNDYGHPHKETLQKLSKLETTVMRTDKQGSIRFYTDGAEFMVESDNG